MKHKRPPIPVIVVVALIVLAAAYFGIRALVDQNNDLLGASGSIEAVEVIISPELSGKVAEVLVDEGDPVQAGDALFRLDGALLQAQRDVAAANLDLARAAAATADAALDSAQAQYDLALDAARAESASTRTSSWRQPGSAGYDLPGWYFGRDEEIAAAQAEVDAAGVARDTAQGNLEALLADPANVDFLAAEMRLIDAKAAFVVVQDVLLRASLASDNADLRQAAQDAYDAARTELDEAQDAYDALAGSEVGQDVLQARAELAVAEERLQVAEDRLLALQTGVYSPRVAAAEAALNQARAAANQAYQAVTQAEASLALVDVQIEKLTVRAPADGVILTRVIQPGEVVAAGSTAMTLARLEDLTITVFVPEDRYGEISLGQAASVTVDSFPGETFTAFVVHIADQAEFTPRNVQTVEGRKSTVFAIRLRVYDPEGKLRPGMPADVTFAR